jgi:hypothetical protein
MGSYNREFGCYEFLRVGSIELRESADEGREVWFMVFTT